MTYYDFINFIESKVTFPFSLSLKNRKQFGFYYYKYSMDFIKECIDAGVKTYFRYDANGLSTQESVNEFLHKIGGILHKRTTTPVHQSINYIQAIGQRKYRDWNKETAKRMLEGYIDTLSLYKCWNKEKINQELRENVVRITRESKDWDEWIDKIYDLNLEAARDDWRRIQPPVAANEY